MLGPPGTYPRPLQRRRSPVRIRRCPATAMPRSGTSQVDRSAPKRTSALGGRAVRAAPAAGPPPPQTRRFFVSGQTIDSRPGRSPLLGEAAALGARPRAPFALSWSGGKDSALVLWTLRRQMFEPEALIT